MCLKVSNVRIGCVPLIPGSTRSGSETVDSERMVLITECVNVNRNKWEKKNEYNCVCECESQEFILHANNNNNEGFRFDCGISISTH